MKTNFLKLTGISLIAGALMFTGCKKDDTTAPDVSILGSASMVVTLNGTFTDPGATATDDEDGDLTSQITVSGSVNVNKTGTYSLTYSVSDAAGNEGSATRTVIVKNSSEGLGGTYSVVSTVTGKYAGTYNYTPTVTASSTVNNTIIISNFGGLNVIVNATVSGTTITIASQSPSGMQDPGSIAGSGVISGNNITSLTYSITYTSGGSDNANDVFSNHQ